MAKAVPINTLEYRPERCINCGMCSMVCPHGVFVPGDYVAELANPDDCMECGACRRNCAVGAISVRSGVGCAQALIKYELTGKKPVCHSNGGNESCS